MNEIQILVVDYGSQYTLIIGRTLRELGVRSIILPPKKVDLWLKNNIPKAIILSGSNWSVHDDGAPELPKSLDVTDLPKDGVNKKYLILGICYGMQLLARKFGGNVDKPHEHREYGPAKVTLNTKHPLFKGIPEKTEVWASHGDTVTKLPKNLIQQIQKEVLDIVDKPKQKQKVILGVSGGVDSTTLAAILAPVLGKKLICIAIDTRDLRKNEIEELKKNTKSAGIKNLVVIKAGEKFIKNIFITIDGEEKRSKFREVYKSIFETQIAKYKAGFIVQGTLATDIIESGKAGESVMIKTHHNVGLTWIVEDLHTLRNLFKYEVRELAGALNLPKTIYERNPFPGPGLYLRVVGAPVTKENIELVREADKTVSDILKKYNLSKNISQLIVALLGVNSVGVKGDERVYGHSLAVRAVVTVAFMT